MSIAPDTHSGAQVLGIDLGGTAIKFGRFDRSGTCLQTLTVPTPQPATPNAVLDAMVEAIALVDPEHQCHAIGVGTPGPADAAGRVARVAINLAGWINVPLADWLEEKTGRPTVLANDANCAGLGEAWLGAGRTFQDLIMLTLGTGVGGAVVLNGKLFVGRQGTAAELGLITLNPDGPECNSGNRGSLEQHASVQAIRRRTGLEPAELGERARQGDAEAIAFWQTYGRELGAGLASLVYVLTPEVIILGGGVSASAEFFFPALKAELEQRVLPSSRDGLQILTAELGNQAGIVGAAKLAWQLLDSQQHQTASVHSSNDTSAKASQLSTDNLTDELHRTRLAYQMASEMSRFKAGFLARSSHELRSPINSVLSLHQLIISELCDSPEEERDFVHQAYAAAKRMLALLDELVAISKAEYGSASVEIQPIALVDVLEDVHRLTHLQAQNRNLRLTIDFPEPDVYVLADPRWLRQALVSLLDTPIALMQEGTLRVTSQLSPATGEAYLLIEDQRPASCWQEPNNLLMVQAIADSGETAAATKQQILEQVAELEASAKHTPGLNLLICQTLLQLMNGRLELLAAPGLPLTGMADLPPDATVICCTIPMVVPEL